MSTNVWTERDMATKEEKNGCYIYLANVRDEEKGEAK